MCVYLHIIRKLNISILVFGFFILPVFSFTIPRKIYLSFSERTAKSYNILLKNTKMKNLQGIKIYMDIFISTVGRLFK